jgi:hypothetical protein
VICGDAVRQTVKPTDQLVYSRGQRHGCGAGEKCARTGGSCPACLATSRDICGATSRRTHRTSMTAAPTRGRGGQDWPSTATVRRC